MDASAIGAVPVAWQGDVASGGGIATSVGASGPVPCEGAYMRKYIIMGIQGSGKGIHAKMLAQDFDLVHIAVGDIFRWNVQNHTKIGARVRRTMAGRQLVGDDLVEGVVRGRLSEHDWNYGFIIDGFRATSARRSSSWRATTSTGHLAGPARQ